MALALTNPYLSNLQGNYTNTPSTNQYGGSTNGLSQITGTPNANIGTTVTKTNPAPKTAAPAASTAATDNGAAAAAQAAQAAAAAHAALVAQVQAGAQGIQSGGASSIRDLANTYGQNNLATVRQLQAGEQGINSSRENTALNLRRSMANVLATVRNGFHSGQAQLAGMNATDSGATADLARAYALQGGQQASDAHNQAFVENQATDQQQTALDQQRKDALDQFATYRSTEVDRISNDLYNQLRTLDANAAASGVTGQVDYGVRDQLINQAIAQLNAIDQQTSQTLAGVTAETPDQVNARAAQLNSGGSVGFQAPGSSVI